MRKRKRWQGESGADELAKASPASLQNQGGVRKQSGRRSAMSRRVSDTV